MKRIGRRFALALAWAIAWAPLGILLGLIVDPDGSRDEMWVAIGAYPGFLCGVVFCIVFAIAERGRPLDEVPLARVGMWGMAAGSFVGALPFFISTPKTDLPLWQWAIIAIGIFTVTGTVSAVVSALIARKMKTRRLRPA